MMFKVMKDICVVLFVVMSADTRSRDESRRDRSVDRDLNSIAENDSLFLQCQLIYQFKWLPIHYFNFNL